MKTLYLECSMGAAGDMLTAALLELLPEPQLFLEQMKAALPESVSVLAERVAKQGITGTQMRVLIDGHEETVHDAHEHHHEHGHHHDHEHPHDHDHEHRHHEHEHEHHHHHHASMQEITDQIMQMHLPEPVLQHSIAVYQLIAEAESHTHGCEVSEIHFHEVGTKDAIADIVGVCLLMHLLAPECVIVSPVHVGSGHVHCAHGILPVPAPATVYLLRDIPIYGGSIEGELCTPTGAALLRHFADAFGDMPIMRVQKIGHGLGKKAFSRLNCVRAFLGDTEEQTETVAELVCNLDDMTGEALGFAQEELLHAGALDVFTVPILMKKGRHAFLLTCLCKPEQREAMRELIYLHTTTLGIRERICVRSTLQREITEQETAYGTVRVKRSSGYGVIREKPEFDDLARIARTEGISLDAARRLTEK